MKGHLAGLLTLILTIGVTTITYRMPVQVAVSAAVLGMLNGLVQIGWIILAAVFLYNLTVESGQLEVIKSSISSISTDRRIQALLIAFCFSAFMEGTAGLGAVSYTHLDVYKRQRWSSVECARVRMLLV